MIRGESERDYAGGLIRLALASGLAVVTIDRPAVRNAISQAMWQAFAAIAADLDADPTLRVVLLRGAGETFSAGADIAEFETVFADPASRDAYNAIVREAQAALRAVACPTIAVIDGNCIGGGCGLALACDLRFASARARFAITPAKLGLGYSFGDTLQLVEKVGAARAKDMLFSARALAAEEALAAGLVDRVFAVESVEAEALAYAETVADLSQATIRSVKRFVNAIADRHLDGTERFEPAYRAVFEAPDFAEGRSAFMEKRKPRFR